MVLHMFMVEMGLQSIDLCVLMVLTGLLSIVLHVSIKFMNIKVYIHFKLSLVCNKIRIERNGITIDKSSCIDRGTGTTIGSILNTDPKNGTT